MTGIVAGDVVFPVFGAGAGPKGDLEELCGTAFSIGPGVFMTAGHVVKRRLLTRLLQLVSPALPD